MSRAQLDTLGRIAREAGDLIMDVYAGDFGVDYKGPGDPVTEGDRRANAMICERISKEFPGTAIVAEESPEETFAGYQTQERVFFVDPLDGTREFVARNGQFVVMIGLVVEDQAQLGVVYSPTSDVLWAGERGVGAFRVTSAGQEAITVSDVSEPEAASLTISRSRRSEKLLKALERIRPARTAPMGSAGLKGSHVADRTVDAYVSVGFAGKHWDACPLDAIVSAAGGRVTDARGTALNYRAPSLDLRAGLVAANPALHARLIERIAGR